MRPAAAADAARHQHRHRLPRRRETAKQRHKCGHLCCAAVPSARAAASQLLARRSPVIARRLAHTQYAVRAAPTLAAQCHQRTSNHRRRRRYAHASPGALARGGGAVGRRCCLCRCVACACGRQCQRPGVGCSSSSEWQWCSAVQQTSLGSYGIHVDLDRRWFGVPACTFRTSLSPAALRARARPCL